MASVCEVCGKKPQFGMRLSHSHRRTKRRWNPNMQKVRAVVNGSPKRLHVCTSCLKAGKVQKPLGIRRVQGVVRTYDPHTGEGIVVRDTDRAELVLAADALEGSIFRMLRQGQRVNFDLDADGRAMQRAPRLRGRHGPPHRPGLSNPRRRRSTRR